jgi:hypothetical protein
MMDKDSTAVVGDPDSPEYIGLAWIGEDEAIRMRLHTASPASDRGLKVYAVDDPHYHEILAHLGPMRPGELVSVRRFD